MLTFTPARGGSNYSAIINSILHNTLHNTAHKIAHSTLAHLGPPLPAHHIPARVVGIQPRAELVDLPSCTSQFLHPVQILNYGRGLLPSTWIGLEAYLRLSCRGH